MVSELFQQEALHRHDNRGKPFLSRAAGRAREILMFYSFVWAFHQLSCHDKARLAALKGTNLYLYQQAGLSPRQLIQPITSQHCSVMSTGEVLSVIVSSLWPPFSLIWKRLGVLCGWYLKCWVAGFVHVFFSLAGKDDGILTLGGQPVAAPLAKEFTWLMWDQLRLVLVENITSLGSWFYAVCFVWNSCIGKNLCRSRENLSGLNLEERALHPCSEERFEHSSSLWNAHALHNNSRLRFALASIVY